MPATVRLNDIVDALETQVDEFSCFLNRDTGRVETVSDDLLHLAEEPGEAGEADRSEWQREEWETAKRIVSTGCFLRLPTKFDVHEWDIMRNFSRTVEADNIREDLLSAIHRSGAFRMFKNTVREHGIESVWFEFRTDALRKIALDWCEEHKLAWE